MFPPSGGDGHMLRWHGHSSKVLLMQLEHTQDGQRGVCVLRLVGAAIAGASPVGAVQVGLYCEPVGSSNFWIVVSTPVQYWSDRSSFSLDGMPSSVTESSTLPPCSERLNVHTR